MTTIILDEITRNAILAALDERAARLEKEVARHRSNIDSYSKAGEETRRLLRVPKLIEDAQRALVWNIAALHETNMARLQIGEAEPWSESEMRLAAGDR